MIEPPKAIALAVTMLMAAACGGDDADGELTEELQSPDDPYVEQPGYGFDAMDVDRDRMLTPDEFLVWSEGPEFGFYYERVVPGDTENVGPLDEETLIDLLFAAWDVDDDGSLDEMEWAAAARVLESISDTTATWLAFDVDPVPGVQPEEVLTRMERDAALQAIDAGQDGEVTEGELNRWFFALFDVDDNGAIDRDEWRLAEQYLDVPLL